MGSKRGVVTFIAGLLLALKRRDRPLNQIHFDRSPWRSIMSLAAGGGILVA
jgi:hypothetical protein